MKSQDENKYTFHVNGMRCKSCVLVIDDDLQNTSGITSVKTNLNNHTVEVVGDFGDKSTEEIASELSSVLAKHKYTLTVDKQTTEKKWDEFKVAIPVAVAFGLLFVILQKIGLLNLIGSGNVTYSSAFVIGLIASLSSCMAVVGGLVLSMSATFAKEGDRVRPQILFHAGRIVSFFILGGVIGSIGAVFTPGLNTTFVLNLIVGIVMLILGINLLDIFHFTKQLQPAIPRFISNHVMEVSKLNHFLTPLLVGIATFFLPCGFTQSMQLYSITTGSFLEGGLTMLSFALGTLPVLALIGFSSFSIKDSAHAGKFFKTAGLIVIMFALFNIINGFVVIGFIPPIFNF